MIRNKRFKTNVAVFIAVRYYKSIIDAVGLQLIRNMPTVGERFVRRVDCF